SLAPLAVAPLGDLCSPQRPRCTMPDRPPDQTAATLNLPPTPATEPATQADGPPRCTDDSVTLVPTAGPRLSAPTGIPTVAGYEILGELGRGGMGVVYKARQVRADRVVALKMVLSGGHASPADLARFCTEAESVARLTHPNIVQIHDVGEQDGLHYFAQEFCGWGIVSGNMEGGTAWSPQEAARMVELLARAMGAAHAANVIHRDLKPANVLLAEDGTPKITDFGLAKKIEGNSGQTQAG